MNFICNSTFWTALSAIGTLLAVCVSLYLANRPKKKKKLIIHTISRGSFTRTSSKKVYEIVITVLNVGDVPIIIDECGILKDKNNLDVTYNKFIKTKDYKGKLIKSGSATTIVYNFDGSTDYYNAILKRNSKFVIRDTTNHIFK